LKREPVETCAAQSLPPRVFDLAELAVCICEQTARLPQLRSQLDRLAKLALGLRVPFLVIRDPTQLEARERVVRAQDAGAREPLSCLAVLTPAGQHGAEGVNGRERSGIRLDRLLPLLDRVLFVALLQVGSAEIEQPFDLIGRKLQHAP